MDSIIERIMGTSHDQYIIHGGSKEMIVDIIAEIERRLGVPPTGVRVPHAALMVEFVSSERAFTVQFVHHFPDVRDVTKNFDLAPCDVAK